MFVLNKCSELCSRIGKREKDNSKLQGEYYRAAVTYAQMALKIDPKNSESNCVMAIALGRTALSKSGREKIENAKEIKKYLDISLAIDPKNYKAWHVLGRWQFEISNLNALERALVKILFGALPPASISQAIASYEKARSLKPEFILNYYEMALAYQDNDNKSKAIASLRYMIKLPNQTEDDPMIKNLAMALLKKWE